MVRLVRVVTDRNPPTLGGGGCQDPSLRFAYGDYLVKTLKVERMCFDSARVGLALYSTSAGYANDKVLVRIPSAGEDPFPEMPSWFREVKESEFLAAQGL